MADREERKAIVRARHRRLLQHERALWRGGAIRVAGLDEAGSGPLAGPVFAGCVVLKRGHTRTLVGVNDSKQLTEMQRERLAARIEKFALAWAVAESSVEEIDTINIREAGILAMQRALDEVCRKLACPVDHLLVDARAVPRPGAPQTSIIGGDAKSLSIAAASILAKVYRDRRMLALAAEYPLHGFDKHKGYATREHQEAIRVHGVTPAHRRSFAPVRAIVSPPPPLAQGELFPAAPPRPRKAPNGRPKRG